MTKREMFEGIAGVLDEIGTDEQVAFIDAQIALLDKRSAAGRKPTAGQVANEDLKGFIATEVAKAMDVTVQKASQLLRQLVLEGTVIRTEGKGKEKTTFAVA
jgi:hypothetical protein